MPLLPSPRHWLSRAALTTALVPVIAAPLLIGGVHAQVGAALAAVLVLALCLNVIDRLIKRTAVVSSWLALPIVIGLVWSLIAILPLPELMRALLSPASVDQLTRLSALLSPDARELVRPVLSFDPPETALAVLRLTGALACFVVVCDRSRRREDRAFAFRVLLVGALVLFVVAAGHRLANFDKVWGRFGHADTPFYAPLVNPNHLARAFGAYSFLCLARALTIRSRVEALWFSVGAVLCGAGVLLTLSRGGILVYLVVLALFVVFFLRAEPDEDAVTGKQIPSPIATRLRVLAPVLGIVTLVAGLYVAREAIVKEMTTLQSETIERSKAFLYAPAWRLARTHWLTGVGNDAFGTTVTSVAEPGELPATVVFTHAENLLFETLTDHGIVVGFLIFLAGAAGLVVVFMSLRRRAHVAAAFPLAFLLLGDIFDFALQIPAGALLGAVCLGLLAARTVEDRRARVEIPRAAAAVLLAALAATTAWAARVAVPDWRYDVDARLAETKGPARAHVLQASIARHPSDAQFAYQLAVEARRWRDPKGALRWANAALNRWPAMKGAHVEAARALAARGLLDQALLEYQLAWQAGGADGRLVHEIASRTKDHAQRKKAIPDDDAAALGALCGQLGAEQRADEAQVCWDEAAALKGATEAMRTAAIETALARGDVHGAQLRLDVLLQTTGREGGYAVLAARTLEASSGADVAYEATTEWLRATRTPGPLLEWRLSRAVQLKRFRDAHGTIEALRKSGGNAAAQDRLDRMEVDLLVSQGRGPEALRMWTRIAARSPRDVGAQLREASMELDLGMKDSARSSYARAQRVAPKDPGVIAFGKRLDGVEQSERDKRMKDLLRGPPTIAPKP